MEELKDRVRFLEEEVDVDGSDPGGESLENVEGQINKDALEQRSDGAYSGERKLGFGGDTDVRSNKSGGKQSKRDLNRLLEE